MGVSKNRGTPKWMVYFMENPIKMDDLGVPLFLETPKSLQTAQHPSIQMIEFLPSLHPIPPIPVQGCLALHKFPKDTMLSWRNET